MRHGVFPLQVRRKDNAFIMRRYESNVQENIVHIESGNEVTYP